MTDKQQKAPTRLVGYCRVSTKNQADEGISIETQQERLKQYAELYKHDLVATYIDAGVSAKTLNRPGIQQALLDLRKGKADGLLVVKLDRLTRSIRDLGELIDDYFSQGKWSLVSVNEQFDTRTAAGRMVLNILVSISQWEREIISERTRDALAYLKDQGLQIGPLPIGWELTGDIDQGGHKLIKKSEKEQDMIQKIKVLHQQGMSLRDIADVLTKAGYATKRGGRWQAQTIANVLKRKG